LRGGYLEISGNIWKYLEIGWHLGHDFLRSISHCSAHFFTRTLLDFTRFTRDSTHNTLDSNRSGCLIDCTRFTRAPHLAVLILRSIIFILRIIWDYVIYCSRYCWCNSIFNSMAAGDRFLPAAQPDD
jgi:hypothetical protein